MTGQNPIPKKYRGTVYWGTVGTIYIVPYSTPVPQSK